MNKLTKIPTNRRNDSELTCGTVNLPQNSNL